MGKGFHFFGVVVFVVVVFFSVNFAKAKAQDLQSPRVHGLSRMMHLPSSR